uniref:Protein kinase domain-containing protein n=1 Tax=Brassica oleracea var. oleracea TaxID=109376 RepID=A0A0D3DQ54_BRAOL
MYTPAIDIWNVGCIFAEMLLGKPLFPGKNVVHQLDLMTDFLGTPPPESISKIRNEKARRYLSSMRKKQPVPFSHNFLKADPLALRLLERLLAFDPKDRASAEDALSDPYFSGLSNSEREPSTQPISKLEFDFERKKLNKDDVRELIYREILEYHPQMLEEYKRGGDQLSFMYPSGVDRFKRQFAYLEENQGKPGAGAGAGGGRKRVPAPNGETAEGSSDVESRAAAAVASTLESEEAENGGGYSARSLMKSASISGSKCINVQSKTDKKFGHHS